MRPEGPARGAATFKARAHQPGGTGSLALAVLGASSRACEGGCNLQWGDMGSYPGGGRCILKGRRGGLHTSKPGHNNPRGQGVLPGRWSVRSDGLAEKAAVSKARAHQPWGTWGPAQAVVGVSGRACEGGCSLQGPGTQAWGERGCCPGGGRCVVKGLGGGGSLQIPGTPAWGDRGSRPGGGRCVRKGR